MKKNEKIDIYNNTYDKQNMSELYNCIKEGLNDISKNRIKEFSSVISEIKEARK